MFSHLFPLGPGSELTASKVYGYRGGERCVHGENQGLRWNLCIYFKKKTKQRKCPVFTTLTWWVFFYVLLCSHVLGAAGESQSGKLHILLLSVGSVILHSFHAYQETVSGGY